MLWTFATAPAARFIGIDIAKDTLDWAVYTQKGGFLLNIHTENTLKGIKSALTQLKALAGWNPTQAVFCMEHTARISMGYTSVGI
ncbi:IS110 family transposase [Spirosoma sp. SC4-14]|uniref:IS110 family transposase n=1 Tax=Spirosoma sp. SC4-14 TaxID=3128900 RepID=UPI0030D07C61